MPTKLIRSFYNITPAMQGAVVTIGNFDGVHMGHQKLIASVIEKAKAMRVPSLVITFEPHPFEFFAKDNVTIPRITRLREKFSHMAALGVDGVLILLFNQELAEKSAIQFATDILHHAIKASHVIIGDDFHFGRDRQGDRSLLTTLGQTLGFSVQSIPAVMVDGERVSSTRVRKALACDDLALVKRLLGRPYSMQGRVRLGDQRGRQWGFPTANIFVHRQLTPIRGVYTVYVHGIADKPWPGVANIGIRPTIDGTRTLLEVHLLDFNQQIYGRYVEVEFCTKLRDEIKYPNIDLLIAQIANDVIDAKKYFNGVL